MLSCELKLQVETYCFGFVPQKKEVAIHDYVIQLNFHLSETLNGNLHVKEVKLPAQS